MIVRLLSFLTGKFHADPITMDARTRSQITPCKTFISKIIVSNAFSPKIGSAIMNHLQHGHFMPNMERYSVDEFADDIGLEDLEAQKAVKELEQQTGRLCKYSARQDF